MYLQTITEKDVLRTKKDVENPLSCEFSTS